MSSKPINPIIIKQIANFRKFKKEQKKNLNAPMTRCDRCGQFKFVIFYDIKKTWVCFNCVEEIEADLKVQREKNYNPSRRGSI